MQNDNINANENHNKSTAIFRENLTSETDLYIHVSLPLYIITITTTTTTALLQKPRAVPKHSTSTFAEFQLLLNVRVVLLIGTVLRHNTLQNHIATHCNAQTEHQHLR